ncbi:hypothetical protein [Moritella sp. F3]|uniref:hypothetical protein n=1 Tax=Moritella sp. F3 TaxID=2718882 RepID=UPI0018E16213|nr:hypothetical protein [Moritella sp. F3]GIC77728.1 hypothetical protein FMO001_24550 [Moritella sp. F1]GIC82141.1 hypothetical protein FMO003_24220 [Moritella sp. F3]
MSYSNLVIPTTKTFEVYRHTNEFMDIYSKYPSGLTEAEEKIVNLKRLGSISIDAAIELWREHNQYFEIAAKVIATDIDEVFTLTNSINHFWGDNEQVELISENTFNSSTSIGDVIIVEGRTLICACAGWQDITF